jgi:RNA polymerase sigma-70 factor (ECF subfamily)
MSDDACQQDSPAEDDLVARVRADCHALAALYDIYYSRVLRYCWRRLGNRAAAEDVTSDVFLSVASHIAEFAGLSASDFRRWLFRIANNSVSATLRQSLRRDELLETAARDGRLNAHAAPSELDALDWPLVYAAIAALSEREQAIVSLRFFAGLSHDEIGSVVDASPGAVRTALSRALASLRERLAAAGLLEPNV